jgi:transposase InsO family protein
MMLDSDVAAASPTTVWRVLNKEGPLRPWKPTPSKKGTGFQQPLGPHQHWHVDVSYINVSGTFYYLVSVLDGCSRYIARWDIRESITEVDVEIILDRAKEKAPAARPRIIPDKRAAVYSEGFQGAYQDQREDARQDFSPLSASNGKIERWHQSLKREYIRPGTPLSVDVMPAALWPDMWSIIATCAFTAPQDMWLPRLNWRHEERRSLPTWIANWRAPGSNADCGGKLLRRKIPRHPWANVIN